MSIPPTSPPPTPDPTTEPAPYFMPGHIARLEEARIATALAAIAPASRPWLGGVLAAGEPGTWINMAVGAGMNAEGEAAASAISAADIAEMCAFFESRGIEPRLEIAPFVANQFIAAITEAGFIFRNFETILACDTERWRPPDGWSMPSGLTIRRVDRSEHTGEAGAALCTLMHTTMTGQPPNPADHALLERVIAFDKSEVLIAEMQGEPVGVAMCDLFDTIGALYYGATATKHRGKGIQTAMIVQRLHMIHDANIPLATIGSSPDAGTERNAIRLGMSVAYTKAIFSRPRPGLISNFG